MGMIRVQTEAFDIGHEFSKLKQQRTDIGGFALFVGSVRDLSDGKPVSAMELEHYPGMTEKSLSDIEQDAHRRWPLQDCLIIHRFGKLAPGDDIVLVITAAEHRSDAFSACNFLMDWLKTKAPFWKLESDQTETRWVEAKASDVAATARWTR
jgi:molybdopterin synthase catalytic subunit